MQWPLGLQNTSMDTKFRVQNFTILLINQLLKVPGSTASLNWGNAPNTQKVFNSAHSYPLGLISTDLMEYSDLKTLGYLLCTTIHDLSD